MSTKTLISAIAALSVVSAIVAATHDFVPDYTFKGSSLTGWHTVGHATWRAENGELAAKPDAPEGGWLVMDKGYQDLKFYTEFRCTEKCDAGVLVRAAKTPEGGLQGVYVPLTGERGTFEITLDKDGKELSRKPMLAATAQFSRVAVGTSANGYSAVPGFARPAPTLEEQQVEAARPPAPPAVAGGGAGRGGAAGGRGGRGGPGGAPSNEPKPGEWNTVDIIMDADMVTTTFNGRRGGNTATSDHMMGFGPVALHVAGNAEVRFRDVALKDFNRKSEPKELVSSHFRKQQLMDFFYSWGAAAGDINKDGVPDVVAGPFYFLGPDYTERHEFTAARTYAPSAFPEGHNYLVYDYTGDGWPDIICVNSRPIFIFVNPKGESRRWDRYNIVPNATSEVEVFRDIDGDGVPDILMANQNAMAYATVDKANPTAPWKIHTVSEPGLGPAHGMGVGDIDGDGRMDIVNSRGWWSQPASGAGDKLWEFHSVPMGTGGAEMGVYDVNGDGLADIVTAIAAHGYGLAWFEQKRDAQKNITFVRHDIMGDFAAKNAGNVTFTEPHAAAFADMDGDGVPDMIVGKRLFSHLESHLDPDPFGPAVLYWYRTVRNSKAEGGAEFVPELIHNRSGVGSQFVVTDMNNDGTPDVVISSVKGTFIFWNQMPARRQPARR
ncbi:MAG: FG-GAP-like repeat-containing protein [Candidatus Solibacter sp.]